ncbi:MAG: DUF5302 domain-containing protein [Nocardioidaceae bacterium]
MPDNAPGNAHDNAPENGNDDIKAKMREALDRKHAHDSGVGHKGHEKEKGHETHGPQGGVHMHRRKAGGGGA